MQKIIYSSALLIVLALFTINTQANAQTGLSGSFSSSSPLNTAAAASGYKTDANAFSIASSVISVALSILGTIFLILILYGGIIWMLAEGNEQRVERAGNIIRQALIGLIIVISAYGISYALLKMFSGQLK